MRSRVIGGDGDRTSRRSLESRETGEAGGCGGLCRIRIASGRTRSLQDTVGEEARDEVEIRLLGALKEGDGWTTLGRIRDRRLRETRCTARGQAGLTVRATGGRSIQKVLNEAVLRKTVSKTVRRHRIQVRLI